jgi:hypothetical protein
MDGTNICSDSEPDEIRVSRSPLTKAGTDFLSPTTEGFAWLKSDVYVTQKGMPKKIGIFRRLLMRWRDPLP